VKNKGGSANIWWERSPFSGYSNIFCCVLSDGFASNHIASTGSGVAFGFCV
jgi:hypothetical protein